MNIFNLQQLIQIRNKAAKNFKNFNFLKISLSKMLLEHLDYIKGDFPLVLDIGSHQGEVANILYNHPKVKDIVSLEISKNMLVHDKISKIKVLSSFNALPFADNTFNLVTSVFSLHNCNNLLNIMKEIHRVLNKNGVLLLSIPCLGNIATLHDALIKSELDIYNQSINRIHPFLDIKSIGNLASESKFVSIITLKEEITIMYKSLKNILKDLRGMGENNILNNKPKKLLNIKFWNKFTELMNQSKDKNTKCYPIKVEVCNLLAWKN